MKHLKLFENANELQTYVEGTEYVEPFVGTDSQGGGVVRYNRVLENIIRIFTQMDGTFINKYLHENDIINIEPVELKGGWNSLDMTNDFKYGFREGWGPLAATLYEVDFSHYTGAKIYPYMFANSQISKIMLPDTIKELQEKCFISNISLGEVVLGKNTKIIGPSVFSDCKYLTKCVLPEGLTEIQDSAFVNTAIERLILPKSIEKLGKDVCSVYTRGLYEILPTVRFQGLEPPVLTIESFREGTRLEVPMAAVETYKNINIPGWKEKFGDNIVGY